MQLFDVIRLLGFALLGAAFGGLLGSAAWGVAGGILAAYTVLYTDLTNLLRWLRHPKGREPPERSGVLEHLTLEIDYLRERHKKRKKKLASYLKQFQQATRALPDATVVLDVNDEVRWANKAARKSLGVRWPDDDGQRITNLIRQPNLRDFIELQRDANDQQTIEIESPTHRERQLSILTAPYGTNQRILVARDVTQLHRANQVRSDFVANVSHELRTPITVFRGYLENLQAQADKAPPGWDQALAQMTVQSERMRSLVEELLLLSSLEADDRVPQPEPVNVAQLINDVHARAAKLSGAKEHLFALEIDHELYIEGDGGELFSAFANLVDNAVHYTGARGVIRLNWFADDNGAHFVVEDNGVGIAPEHLPRLTERFYRVDPSRERNSGVGGTGLGLAIVKHVLSRHQGELSITSTPGVGSLFSADFPRRVICEAPAAARTAGQRDAG